VVAASDLASATVTAQAAIKAATGVDEKGEDSQSQIGDSVESPIDYNASEIKKLPLSSDSMVLDAQYFRSEVNQDGSSTSSNSIASYVNAQCSGFLSPSVSTKVAGQAKDVSISQHKHHDVEGTIVITANCTHKQAQVFAPYVMDVDKAVRSWNAMFKDDPIVVDDRKSLEAAIKSDGSKTANVMNLLSGATYGSSFVGLVHILKREQTDSTQSSLGEYDDKNNKVIDTNSLMTAMEDYVEKAIAGDAGVPINFFLKPITANELAEAYLNKYYPREFVGEESASDNQRK